jgi:hypothetical protein
VLTARHPFVADGATDDSEEHRRDSKHNLSTVCISFTIDPASRAAACAAMRFDKTQSKRK